ncbi:hypothetical protein QUW13_02660 [Enterococcus hirae]|nr:hypothetical protein [Enterococcus hirae]
MELEKKIEEHEEILRDHSGKLRKLSEDMKEVRDEIKDGLTRVNESNRFLREQNTRQGEQNTEILHAILEQKDQNAKRDHELKMLNRSNMWKLVLLIGGTSSVITVVLDKILNIF